MRFIKDMKLQDTVKIKENGVPVDYTLVHKLTPDSPFMGHTSGIVLVRNEYIASPDKVLPLLIVLDEAIVNDDGILIGSDKEVDTDEIYSRS